MPDVIKKDKRFTRVMKFPVASSERPIAKIMATRGFADEDRQEGWGLLDTAAGRHLAIMLGLTQHHSGGGDDDGADDGGEDDGAPTAGTAATGQ